MKVLMPQLGETVAEGTVAAWRKRPGDTVEKNEILLDVETDKAATEVPAPVAGVIASVLVPDGETVDVGTVLAVIESDEAAASPVATEAPARRRAAETTSDSPGEPTPAGRATRRAGSARSRGGKVERPRLSPVVRRLLAEHDIDARELSGSGRHGRITRDDVLSFVEQRASGEATRIPFDRIRRVTAEHMVRSRATSAHVMQAVEVDFSGVDRVRLPSRGDWRAKYGFSLTYLPFIARAACQALGDFPRVNSSVDGDALVLHGAIHLSVAVDLNLEGLVAPVIRNADALTVADLARAIRDVADRASQGALQPHEYSGGTYTLSNNGTHGTLMTAAIINQPQVAILSVDAISKRPVVVESPSGDAIAIRPVGILAQSFDHRAIDGAYSAAFLQRLKGLLEEKDWSGEL